MTAPPQLVKSAASLIYTMPERKVRRSVAWHAQPRNALPT